jgi:hypothetical protein
MEILWRASVGWRDKKVTRLLSAAIFVLSTTTVGASIIVVPFVFAAAGYVLGAAIMLAICMLSAFAIWLLLRETPGAGVAMPETELFGRDENVHFRLLTGVIDTWLEYCAMIAYFIHELFLPFCRDPNAPPDSTVLVFSFVVQILCEIAADVSTFQFEMKRKLPVVLAWKARSKYFAFLAVSVAFPLVWSMNDIVKDFFFNARSCPMRIDGKLYGVDCKDYR